MRLKDAWTGGFRLGLVKMPVLLGLQAGRFFDGLLFF